MFPIATFKTSRAQRAIRLHAVALCGAVAGTAVAIAYCGALELYQVASVCGCVLLIVLALSFTALKRELLPVDTIEQALSRIAGGTENPFDFPPLVLTSPAAKGWNRLVEMGKQWLTFEALERHLANELSTNFAGDCALLDSLPDGIAATDAEGKVTYANPTLAAMCTATDRESLLRKTFGMLWASSDSISSQFGGGSAVARTSFNLTLSAAAGGQRTLRFTRTALRAAGGYANGHTWVVRDVTQQRLAEEMRDQFLATATHELRTPLANIRAYAESLATADDLDLENQKQFYNIIQSEAVRLSQLIDDLLDVSRMQAGALAIDRRETDLERLIDEASKKVEAQMRMRRIDFRRELPLKYPPAYVDKSQLAAALVNLLGNAAKYTPEGGRVTFRVVSADDQLEFSIIDTGFGISPEERLRVFDRFFRSSDDRVRDTPGSGLGLALTQEIARLHGGELTVDSELNVGSTFRLTIPLGGSH